LANALIYFGFSILDMGERNDFSSNLKF